MIANLNLYQRSLHHTKMAAIENEKEFEYVTYRLFEDMTTKMNEIIEEQNRATGRRLLAGPATRYYDINDNIYVAYPGSELSPNDPDEFDVVILPDLYPFKDSYFYPLQEALKRAKKRVVFGFYDAPEQEYVRLHRYLNTIVGEYKWFSDEADKPTYIIDKTI